MSEFLDVLKNRRSIRKYNDKPVEKEKIDTIIEAGLYAPTGMGKQGVKFIAITDKAERDNLSEMNRKIMGVDFDPFYGAPTVITVVSDKNAPTYLYDGAIAIGNMLNTAYELGLSSCWIHRAKEEFESEEGKALLKKWGVEGDVEGIGHVILGYSDEPNPDAAPRNDGRVFYV